MKSTIPYFLFTISIFICIASIGLYTVQENLIFGHTKLDKDASLTWETHQHAYTVNEFTIKTDDGGSLSGISCIQNDAKGNLLYFHGKASNLGHRRWEKVCLHFINEGYNVFLFDYREFGKSSGTMNEELMLNDGCTVYDYVSHTYPTLPITLYGKSLGTTFATYVASKKNSRKLLLEAPFYNMDDAATFAMKYIPSLIIYAINSYKFKTNEWIQNVKCPITLFHGTKDVVIPDSASHKLFSLIQKNTNAALHIIEDGDHDHLFSDESFIEIFRKELRHD